MKLDNVAPVTQKFDHLVDVFGLSEAEVENARLFFYAGIRMGLKEEEPKVALLEQPQIDLSYLLDTRTTKEMQDYCKQDVEQTLNLNLLLDNVYGAEFDTTYEDPLQFNQSELQQLSFVMKNLLNTVQSDIRVADRAIAMWWNHSDASKNDVSLYCEDEIADNEYAFKQLNYWKDVRRNYAKANKRWSDLQRKIKKLSKVV